MKRALLLLLLIPVAHAELEVLAPVILEDGVTFRITFPGPIDEPALLEVGDGRNQSIPPGIPDVDMEFEAPPLGTYTATLSYAINGTTYREEATYEVVKAPPQEGAPGPGLLLVVLALGWAVRRH